LEGIKSKLDDPKERPGTGTAFVVFKKIEDAILMADKYKHPDTSDDLFMLLCCESCWFMLNEKRYCD
jgi:hypothetical protein